MDHRFHSNPKNSIVFNEHSGIFAILIAPKHRDISMSASKNKTDRFNDEWGTHYERGDNKRYKDKGKKRGGGAEVDEYMKPSRNRR